MLIVMKFGGSSLATPAHIRRAAALARRRREEGDQVVVVVSAQGDTTDALLAQARELSREPQKRENDVLLSCGEQMSMALFSMALWEMGCPAQSFCGWQAGIRTGGEHGRARILRVEPQRIRSALDEGKVVVAAGFQGVDALGDITTIGRGGSDTTAVALAAALGADVCQIYTDVRGVFSADPRLVSDAVLHREISYDEMLELASLGAKVLHSRAVELARETGVRIQGCSSLCTGDRGPLVGGDCPGSRVRGVTSEAPVAMFTVHGLPAGNATSRLFTALAASGVSIDVIIRSPGPGEDRGRVSFSVRESDCAAAGAVLRACGEELGIEGFVQEPGLAKISAVGAGMTDGCGVAAQMLRALEGGHIEPRYITTGEIRISVLVPREEEGAAVRLIHESFFPQPGKAEE